MTLGGADAARFVEAAQAWLNEAADGQHGGLDTGAAECGACPLCRAARALRTADPAAISALVDALVPAAIGIIDVLKDAGERLLATDPDRLRSEESAAAADNETDPPAAAAAP
jgi:hypothetical protein